MDELLEQFLLEAPELAQQAVDDLLALERDGQARDRLDGAFRAVHTLKGSVALFDMAPLGEALHAAEDWLAQVRAGRAELQPAQVDRLLDLLGRTEGWFAALGPVGTLPPSAGPTCRAIASALRGGEASDVTAPPPSTSELPDWAASFLQSQGGGPDGGGPCTLVRYAPDAEAFFRGEDPISLVARLPGLSALTLAPAEPWTAPAAYDPFRCLLVITVLLHAEASAARAALRLAGGEVEVVELRANAPEVTAPSAGPRAVQESGRRLRVDPARIDALLGISDDLVAATTALSQVQADGPQARVLAGARQRLEQLSGELHAAVMRVRLAPLSRTFERLPRLVRELSSQLGKPVRLEIEGEELEADRTVVDGVFEPLLHLIRNALDHGIEDAGGRAAAEKPAVGVIRLLARSARGELRLELSDDGRGVDPRAVRRVAEAQRLVAPGAADDGEVLDLLFSPGFSTATEVSAVSGRGVGLDSVRRSVEALGGRVSLTSEPGRGATAILSLPVAAVLARLILVELDGETYGVPLTAVVETARLPRDQVRPVGQGLAAVWRGRTLPILFLHDRLELARPADTAELRLLVVDTAEGERVGLAVDRLAGRLEGVLRPLTGLLAGLPGVLGTTLAADGSVLFVLDAAELAR